MSSPCFLSNHSTAVILHIAAIALVITPASQSHQDEFVVPLSISNDLVSKEGARHDGQKSLMAPTLQGPDLCYPPLDGLSSEVCHSPMHGPYFDRSDRWSKTSATGSHHGRMGRSIGAE